MADLKKFQPAQLFNWWEGRQIIATEDIQQGDILVGCGLLGSQMFVKKASCLDLDCLVGKLLVARHDAPGCYGNRPTPSNYGIAAPWLTRTKNIDTTKATRLGQPVYLGENGDQVLDAPKNVRVVGRVVRIGPASKLEGGEPHCGAIALEP